MKRDYEYELTPEVREKMKMNLVYVGIFSILMLFAGLISAYIVSMGDSFWLKSKLPSSFWVSTVLIAISSLTFIYAVYSVKKNNPSGMKIGMVATFILGILFCWFQFKGYGELVDKGVFFVNNRILVNEGRYGDYFRLKVDNQNMEVDGNDYFIAGKKVSADKKRAIAEFAKPIAQGDMPGNQYGKKYVLLYKSEPLTLLNNQLMKVDGKPLDVDDKIRLRDFALHLRDGRGDFFAKGEFGKDFQLFYKGKELQYTNRTLHVDGRKLSAYQQTSALSSADTASSFLYLISGLHLAHILVTLLFLIKTITYTFTGRYTSDDYLGLRVTGVFWHFLGVLWFILLLFLLFIH